MTIDCPSSQASSSSVSGTRVVLPAPGGASSTTSSRDCRAWRSAGRASSMGRGIMGVLRVQAADCKAAASARRFLPVYKRSRNFYLAKGRGYAYLLLEPLLLFIRPLYSCDNFSGGPYAYS